MTAAPIFGTVRLDTKQHIRVLGVQIDTKLRWGPHMTKVKEKTVS